MSWISPWIHTTDICNMNCHYCYVQGDSIMEKPVYDALESMLLNSDADLYVAHHEHCVDANTGVKRMMGGAANPIRILNPIDDPFQGRVLAGGWGSGSDMGSARAILDRC